MCYTNLLDKETETLNGPIRCHIWFVIFRREETEAYMVYEWNELCFTPSPWMGWWRFSSQAMMQTGARFVNYLRFDNRIIGDIFHSLFYQLRDSRAGSNFLSPQILKWIRHKPAEEKKSNIKSSDGDVRDAENSYLLKRLTIWWVKKFFAKIFGSKGQ